MTFLAFTLAAIDIAAWGEFIGYVLIAALGVGAVIFIHELGHFAVAKWCGVKCEKFYIGFGKPLAKFQWGETEYGIGMIPLGGYVKMLGQDDNPSAASAEMERARLDQGGAVETPVYDPRSYMAKSVPQRMAIISAGVIMNLIFAFVVASIAYGLGVPDAPCRVGGTVPGGGAWRANLQPGDTIVAINGEPVKRFDDLLGQIALGDHIGGVEISYIRAGEQEVREVTVQPNNKDVTPKVGVHPAGINRLSDEIPFIPGSAASKATPALAKGDEIIDIDGVPIQSYTDVQRALAANPSKAMKVTVRRALKEKKGETEEVKVTIDPTPLKTLGIQMKLSQILAVQDESPAADVDVPAAGPANDAGSESSIPTRGLRPGDFIAAIDNVETADLDPLKLPELFRQKAGKPVQLKIQRQGGEKFETQVTPRGGTLFEPAIAWTEHGISIPALGVVCQVLNTVQAIAPGSDADKAGLKVNDKIEWFQILPPPEDEKSTDDEKKLAREMFDYKQHSFGDGEAQYDWPLFFNELQTLKEGQKLLVKVERLSEPVELTPTISTEEYYPLRGLNFAPERILIKAETVGEALSLGAAETWKQATRVYKFIRQLARGNVSVKGAGGPFTIGYSAYMLAARGTVEFLMFLVAISANLAVINFLPIPVLDGGHFVFLTLEGIRGKPASEKLFIGATYAGLAFLLLVMGFVIFLDINRFNPF